MSAKEYIRSITELVSPNLSESTSQLTSSPSSPTLTSSTSSTNYGYFSWQTWIIIILVLALFGINIFAYLAKGTEITASIMESVLSFFGYSTLTTTKQAIETTATGTKAGVDIIAETTSSAIDVVTPDNPIGYSQSIKDEVKIEPREKQMSQDILERAINDYSKSYSGGEPMPVSSGKEGWCFIGEDEGIRTCSEIGVNDICMSGDIFPTQAVCMNPNLRV
jgi:hypothetical protein